MFLRRAGYGYIESRHTGLGSFVRHFGRNRYPRLHMYIHQNEDEIEFSLHLDQKQASYKGSHAHNAEYDGDIVEQELLRLRGLIGGGVINNKRSKFS